jgi:TonB family protein
MMFMAFLAAAAAATTPAPTATALDKASWFSANDYPAAAQRAGIEGSVIFEADVDANGHATDCRITKSSGHPELDSATCDIIRAKAHFKPAQDSAGRPVAGRYSDRIVWRLMGPTGPFYRALVIDFSNDPNHPVCSVKSNITMLGGPTCEQALASGQVAGGIGERVTKLVFLFATSVGDQKPYQGEPEWGDRFSYVAADQYQLTPGSKPVACVPVAAENPPNGNDGCTGFPGARTISDADKKIAIKTHVETAIFAVRRPTVPSAGCKGGESAAEAQSCE